MPLKDFDVKHFRYIILWHSRRNLLSYVQFATSRQRKWRSLDDILGKGEGRGNKTLNVARTGAIILNIGIKSGKHTGWQQWNKVRFLDESIIRSVEKNTKNLIKMQVYFIQTLQRNVYSKTLQAQRSTPIHSFFYTVRKFWNGIIVSLRPTFLWMILSVRWHVTTQF